MVSFTVHPISVFLAFLACTCDSLSAFASKNRWQKAEQVVESMSRANANADIVTYNTLMKAYRQSGEARRAHSLLLLMLGVESYTLSSLSSSSPSLARSLSMLLKHLQQNPVAPDVITFAEAIQACANGGEARLGLRIYDKNVAAKDSSIVIVGAALGCCAKVGDWAKALRIFHASSSAMLQQNAVTVASLVGACAKGSHWQIGLEIVKRAPVINEVAFNNLLAYMGCENNMPSFMADKVMAIMRARGFTPDVRTYRRLVAGFFSFVTTVHERHT
mmetsp:Transcript_4839/g.8752  ORF Transcript_4839/g.8752 Transcript_4839/m.8752 type:complete len:275 (-) Transcript_4839:416-1240(-)